MILGDLNSERSTGKVLSIAEGIIISPTPKSILKGVFVFPIIPVRFTLTPVYSLVSAIFCRFLISNLKKSFSLGGDIIFIISFSIVSISFE